MRPRTPLPAALAGRPFSVQEARLVGVSADVLRRPDLSAGTRGGRLPESLGTALSVRARVALVVMPTAVLSHATAAALWGLPLPRRLDVHDRLHVTHSAIECTTAARRRGITGHTGVLLPEDTTTRNGLRVTSPPRVFLDLAPLLSVDELVALGDAMVCWHVDTRGFEPEDPLVFLSELQRRVAHEHRRRGIRSARAALELVRVGADSEPETRLRLMLVRAGLPEPELNVLVLVGGRRQFVPPDLAYREQRLSIQYDGGHHADPRQHALDIERADLTLSAGWTEVRIAAADLTTLVAVPGWGVVARAVAKVIAALRTRGWKG